MLLNVASNLKKKKKLLIWESTVLKVSIGLAVMFLYCEFFFI